LNLGALAEEEGEDGGEEGGVEVDERGRRKKGRA
jgi:hypothetical protein